MRLIYLTAKIFKYKQQIMRNIISIIFLAIFLVSCVSQEPAPIEYNRARVDADSEHATSVISNEEVTLKPLPAAHEYNPATGYLAEKQPEEPLQAPGSLQDNAKIIYHEVQAGETIEQIAKNYNSTQGNIIRLNDLTTPFKLDEFQIIKIKVSHSVLNKKNSERAPDILASSALTGHAAPTINIIKPVENGKIITMFGEDTKSGKSSGVDIQIPAGTPVKAVADGTVIKSGNSARFGNLVIIKLDAADISVAYAHLKDLMLKVGEKVSQGDIIGHVGSHSKDNGKPQLHFAIREGEKAVDPLKYLSDLDILY